jgi:hypothetical protein
VPISERYPRVSKIKQSLYDTIFQKSAYVNAILQLYYTHWKDASDQARPLPKRKIIHDYSELLRRKKGVCKPTKKHTKSSTRDEVQTNTDFECVIV